MEVGQHVQPRREVRLGARAARAIRAITRACAAADGSRRPCSRSTWSSSAPEVGLAALVQPEPGQRAARGRGPRRPATVPRRPARTPSRRSRCRRSARGGGRAPRPPASRRARRARRHGRRSARSHPRRRRSARARPAAAGGQRPEVGADRARRAPAGRPRQQVVEARPPQEIRLPARRLVREVAPLAGQRALRPRRIAGRPPGQEVGKVKGMRRRAPSSRAAGASATSASGSPSPATSTPPAWSSTRWPVAVHSSASARARWSSQSTVSQRSSPLADTVDRPRPRASRSTSEQVASNDSPATASAGAAASPRAARSARAGRPPDLAASPARHARPPAR